MNFRLSTAVAAAVGALCFACVGTGHAQVTLDGSIAGDSYGSAIAVQTVQTQFGDNFSELNAAYGYVGEGNLYLTLTGNLENNFNKLNIFIDSIAGGQNVIGPDTDNGGNNPTNDGWATAYAGFTFDTGFSADFLVVARNGSFGGDRFDFDFNSVGNTSVEESTTDIFGGTFGGSNASVGASGIGVAFDNSNVDGVVGGTEAADQVAAAAVQTGLELVIPLAAIGNPSIGDEIRISAHVNGSNHDFLSNQFLGGLEAPQGNIGGDVGGTDLNNFAGNQFFSVVAVPEPSSACLLGAIGFLGLLKRRRS